MPAEPTRVRLQRMLVLVPWVLSQEGGPTVDEVCRRFGISVEELRDDLQTLFVCGLPPFTPADLIWADIDEDRVVIQQADWLSRPLRLTRGEAVALLVAGRAIAALPGLDEADALRTALQKLARAVTPSDADAVADLVERVEVELEGSAPGLLATLRRAISEGMTLRITYLSFGRAELTERDVDPLLVLDAGGHWYLVADDHLSGEERSFRLDRIRDASPTGRAFAPQADFDPARYRGGLALTPSESDVEVTLDLAPAAAWVIEQTPHEAREDLSDGWARITLRTAHLEWLVRLLMRLGPAARVLSPAHLNDRLRAAAGRTLERYGATL